MSDLVKTVLTDVGARDPMAAKQVAAKGADSFSPWAGEV